MAFRQLGLKVEDLFSVKVDDIPDDCSVKDLEDAFSKYGKIMDTYIPRDYHSQANKGFAFVRFEYEDQAKEAADGRNDVAGRAVKCGVATRPKPKGDMERGGRYARRDDSRKRGGGRGRSRSRGGRGGSRRGGSRGRSERRDRRRDSGRRNDSRRR